MKKFLIYVTVLVTLLFLGYTTYYLLRNNENITLKLDGENSIYLNTDETCDLPILWTKPYNGTTLNKPTISNNNVVTYNETSKKFTAIGGGIASITVTPSNINFGPFNFDIHVGDGSIANPFFVRTAADFGKIGSNETGNKFKLTNSYIIVNNIDLSFYNNGQWSPIGSVANPFLGNFNGNHKLISNLSILTGSDVGLFGVIGGSGVVENVKLQDVKLSGNFNNAGAIAGINKGLIGFCDVSGVNIINSNENGYCGGIVGSSVLSDLNPSKITSTSCDAIINASGFAGGIAGLLQGSYIYNCKVNTSYTAANANSVFGGMVGKTTTFLSGNDFRFPIIKNTYAINTSITGSNDGNYGSYIGKNEYTTFNGYENVYVGNYYVNGGKNPPAIAISENFTANSSMFAKKTIEELQKKSTYKSLNESWNFKNVWTITEDATLAEINFVEGAYESINIFIGEAISDAKSFMQAIEIIKQAPSVERVFEISGNITIDLEGGAWETIAPLESNPFKGKFMARENSSVTIKNFKLTGNNSSVFGYIDGLEAGVSGIKFENVSIENSTVENIAIISTSLNNGARIENCQINNYTINASNAVNKIGLVTVFNNGTINGIKINTEVVELSKLSINALEVEAGLICSVNNGHIDTVELDWSSVELLNISRDATIVFGGISARNTSIITNAYVYGLSLNNNFDGKIVRVGGLTGTLQGNAKIYNSYTVGVILNLGYSNNNIMIGGFAAISEEETEISNSFVSEGSIDGYRVAGFVTDSKGLINQCYVSESITGTEVGSFAVESRGKILNCYSFASLTGKSDSGLVTGMVVYLRETSFIKNCFSSASISGKGKLYAESYTEFRKSKILSTILKPFETAENLKPSGTLTKCIVVNFGTAYVQAPDLLAFGSVEKNLAITDAECKDGIFSKFKNNQLFDESIWNFPADEGNYPTLRNVIKDIRLIEETPEI